MNILPTAPPKTPKMKIGQINETGNTDYYTLESEHFIIELNGVEYDISTDIHNAGLTIQKTGKGKNKFLSVLPRTANSIIIL